MTPPIPAQETNAPAAESVRASLRGRVISGSVLTLATYGASQVFRLAGNLVFADLLSPEALGLMTLVNVFVTGLAMFSDIGIGPSIIQSRRGEEAGFLNTAWTVQVVRGLLLWLVSVVGARPFAAWYGDPQLASLVPVSALAAVLAGFNSTRWFSSSRRIALARITILEFVGQTVGLLAMVGLCYWLRSVWAIVYGALLGAATKLCLSYLALDGERNAFAFDRGAFREMMGFGRWVFVSTSLSFLATQIDRLMVGKLLSIALLGVYGLAMALVSLPPMVAAALVGAVFFPLLAHHSRTDAKAYERALLDGRRIMFEGALFLFTGIALLSPAFFRILYDDRYADATGIARLLIAPMWTWILMLTTERAVLALGESRTMAISNGISVVCKVAACYAGFSLAGLPGFIVGLAVGFLGGHVPLVLALRRHGVHVLKQDLPYTAIAGILIGGAILLQGAVVDMAGEGRRNAAEIAVAAVLLAPLGFRAARIGMRALRKR